MPLILLICAFFSLLTWLCLRMRIGSRVHRMLIRVVCAVYLVLLFSLIPGVRVHINALTLACVSALGLPGLGLLQVIALMP